MKKIILALALVFGVSAAPAVAGHKTTQITNSAVWKECDKIVVLAEFDRCVQKHNVVAQRENDREALRIIDFVIKYAQLKKRERKEECRKLWKPGFNTHECLRTRR